MGRYHVEEEMKAINWTVEGEKSASRTKLWRRVEYGEMEREASETGLCECWDKNLDSGRM